MLVSPARLSSRVSMSGTISLGSRDSSYLLTSWPRWSSRNFSKFHLRKVDFCNSFYSLAIMIGLVNFFSSMMTVPGTLKLVSNRETFLIAGYSLLSEICLIRYRTPLATLNTSSTNMGWLLGLCIGLVSPLHLHYPTLGLSSVLFLLLCWLLPESPVWLMRRGREREAKQTLSWLRGNKYDIGPEMEDLQKIAELEDQSYGLSISDVFLDKRF